MPRITTAYYCIKIAQLLNRIDLVCYKMNYDQAGNSIRGFTSVQTNRDLQFNTRRYNLHVARIQLVNIARNKQNTPNSPSWSSLPHNPKKIPNSAKQRRVCRISQPGTPLHRSTDLTIHATQFTETAIIDELKGRDKAEHNTQHHHHMRPRKSWNKKKIYGIAHR